MSAPFTAKDRITAAIQAVMELTRDWRRGSLLPWADIERVAGLERGGEHWSAFRVRLGATFERERGITLFHFPPNDGLTLCTEAQTIAAIPLSRGRRAFRQFSKARRAIRSLPDQALSTEERIQAAETDQAIRQAQSAVRRQVKKSLHSPLKWE